MAIGAMKWWKSKKMLEEGEGKIADSKNAQRY